MDLTSEVEESTAVFDAAGIVFKLHCDLFRDYRESDWDGFVMLRRIFDRLKDRIDLIAAHSRMLVS